MKYLVLILLILVLTSCTVVPRQPPIQSHPPLTYKVQIDDPPLVRWAPIIKDFNASIHIFVAEFLDKQPIPKGFYDGVEWFAKNEYNHKDFVA